MPVRNTPELPTWDISAGYAAEMIAVFVIVIAVVILLASSANRRKRSDNRGERPFAMSQATSASARRDEPGDQPGGGKLGDRQPKVAIPSVGC